MISSFALVMTTLIANRNCTFVFHQPKMPESAKKLRKF
ncbi:MAG: cyclic lactone autoinducer peptide [Bacilli bacterium]